MACQDHDDDDDDDAEDEEQAEHDCALVESAGELMPSLVKSVGGHVFAPYFSELLPELLKRLVRDATQLISVSPLVVSHSPSYIVGYCTYEAVICHLTRSACIWF